ncbi:PaaI family thioesterase [Minwuia thermotolerans]|uniref:PaaI family thioesterase n=1 Tax=Minwuia thermotolerans TaxID=2056226 RepID=UPI0013DE1150|nr:PaaI family thioesterase [Minwuia thermotolerans]
MTEIRPPEGFVEMGRSGPFAADNGPFYVRGRAGGGFDYGFVAEPRHENPNGIVHGGMLIAFADHFLGHAVVSATGQTCATVNLTTDYLASARTPSWIQGEAEIVSRSRSMVFLRALVSCGDTRLLSVSSVYRIFEPRG